MTKISVTGFRGVPATWGGIEHHCENLYSRLAKTGYDVTLYARSYYTPKEITSYKDMNIVRLPTLNLKYTDALLHTLISVFHILFKNPDIIHIHGIGPCFFSWIPRLFRPKMKVFFTCHGLDWQRKKWPCWASRLIYLGELCAIRFAQYRIVVSRDLQTYFLVKYGIKTMYIPNGIIPVESRPPELIKKWGLSEKSYFLWVGRIVPEKRLEDVIKAYLIKPGKSKLVIVGDHAGAGSYMNELIQLSKNHESIIFTGYQYGAVLKELFSNARAFITASELEGLPITLLEALSYGIMCITSNICPHQEVMQSLPGFSFGVGDIGAISACMNRVEAMTDTDFEEFKQKANAMVIDQFNWESVCQVHDMLYQNSIRSIRHTV